MKRALFRTAQFTGLVLIYVLLFIVGTRLFPVNIGGPPDPSRAVAQLVGLILCGVFDTALLGWWAAGTRLRGWRRWAALATAFYGTKTFSSQLEALWFMPNVTGSMAPALFAMTLPLCLIFPAVVVTAFGAKEPVAGPAWRAPRANRGVVAGCWAVLSALVYPALFWGAGYFIAYRSAAVRAFYGGFKGDTLLSHFAAVFAADPWVVPFEIFRGLLWILLVLPLIRTSRRHWLLDALLVGAFLALVQNDLHLLPNRLMSPEIRLYHFIETTTSNFVWGFAMVAVLRGWLEHREGAVTGPRDVGAQLPPAAIRA